MIRKVVGFALLFSVPAFLIGSYLLQELELIPYSVIHKAAVLGIITTFILTMLGIYILEGKKNGSDK